MASSVPEVSSFPDAARGRRARAGKAELAELEAYAGRPLEAWDLSYYSERLQQNRFQVSQEELRDYLPLPRVLATLFEVAERLYGVRLRERSGVPVWHADVRYFEVLSPGGAPLASFYLDACARANKRAVPGWTTAVGRKQLNGELTLPVASWSAIRCRRRRAARAPDAR